MRYNSKKLIFVGHFDIGERFTKNTQILANEAIKEKDAVFCVLIGDMDLNRKVKEYLSNGINGIKGIYQARMDCAKSECVLHQLPKTDKGLNQLIDTSHYQKIVEHINNKPTNKSHLELIKEVVANLIEQRIEEYGIPNKRLLIMTETRCRNRATNRIKPKGKYSWHQIKGFRTIKL